MQRFRLMFPSRRSGNTKSGDMWRGHRQDFIYHLPRGWSLTVVVMPCVLSVCARERVNVWLSVCWSD